MKKFRIFIRLILFVLFSLQGQAQEKIERETGVKKDEVPMAAVEFMEDAFEGARKIKWYYEETSGKQSYEAKLKWEGRMNSIEFNANGLVEDIENRLVANFGYYYSSSHRFEAGINFRTDKIILDSIRNRLWINLGWKIKM